MGDFMTGVLVYVALTATSAAIMGVIFGPQEQFNFTQFNDILRKINSGA